MSKTENVYNKLSLLEVEFTVKASYHFRAGEGESAAATEVHYEPHTTEQEWNADSYHQWHTLSNSYAHRLFSHTFIIKRLLLQLAQR